MEIVLMTVLQVLLLLIKISVKASLIFGSKNPFSSPFNLTNLDCGNGFVIKGINESDNFGISVSASAEID